LTWAHSGDPQTSIPAQISRWRISQDFYRW
jgi:hypothetical protein